nr:hypothetical protein L204_05646 [Cryptococcus depauperatus CBS 7855]
MSPVSKKLSSLLSSPSSTSQLPDPQVKASVSPSKRPACRFSLGNGVDRAGMPCAAQLFELFRFAAGDSSKSDLSTADTDSDEDETDHPLSLNNQLVDETKLESTILPPTASTTTVEPESTLPKGDPQVQDWIDKSDRDTEKERDTFSSRFTALSLSNLSAIFLPSSGRNTKSRPVLPQAAMEVSPELNIQLPPANLEGSEPTATQNEKSTLSNEQETSNKGDISNEERLTAIVDEFGDMASLFEDYEPERLLAESIGSIFRGVLMIGNFHLTTHRLLFHASLPPDTQRMPLYENSESSANTAAGTMSYQPDVLYSGPVTVHKPGALRPTRRVWMELSSEMVTTYPSADESGRVRPLKCVLLSSVKHVEPFNSEHPCDFIVTFESPTGLHTSHFTVDTEQSAGQWRRAFHAAIFRQMKSKWHQEHNSGDDWSVMRVCIPLDKVHIKGISAYHNLATLIGLEVDLDSSSRHNLIPTPQIQQSGNIANQKVSKSPSTTRKNSFLPRRSISLNFHSQSPTLSEKSNKPQFSTTNTMDIIAGSNCTSDSELFSFNLAVLNERAWFAEAVQSAVAASRERQYKPGVTKPKFVMEIGGNDCLATDQDLDPGKSKSSYSAEADDDDSDNQLVQETRKKAKAALAAKVFGLREDEEVWIKRCYIVTSFLPARGHIILNPRYICFWRRVTVGTDLKYRFSAEDVKGAVVMPSIRAGFHGMALQLRGHGNLRFEFWNKDARDEVLGRVNALRDNLSRTANMQPESNFILSSKLQPSRPLYSSPEPSLFSNDHPADILAPPKDFLFEPVSVADDALAYLPYVANKPIEAARIKPRTFVCLTIGSRGDVQPYIALGLRLMQDKHKVIIVTHGEFKTWIEGYGIEHRQAGGDPTALMKLSQEHRMFSPGFFKESLGSFRQWLDDLLVDSWEACQDADVLIESPSAMAGIHIAEALQIPYFRAFTMPWTRTTAYPQAFMVPSFEMGPSFNYSTYVLFDNIIWRATAGQINRWRKRHLHLKATDMSSLSVTKVPFLYNFSPSVVPKPLDWHDDVIITGYWNLEDSDTDWKPSLDLEKFMKAAKEDGKPLVYIGFGSIIVPRPNAMTKSIIEAVEKAQVRAIIAKGWSSRGDPAKEGESIVFPSSCFGVDKIPHAWLFPKVQAALHHGGAGTVGASLRAGIPTLIKPWFGDQFFWSVRVTKLGVGLRIPSLRSDDIAAALIKATSDTTMIEKASRLGEKIRSEDGVDTAARAITYNISRAASDRRKIHWAK